MAKKPSYEDLKRKIQELENAIEETKRPNVPFCESSRRYQDFFRNSRDGLVVVDIEGGFIDANPAFCLMLGYTLDELKRKDDFYDITPSRWHDWERKEIWEKRLMHEGYSGIYEKEYIRKDGSVFPIELQSYAVFDEEGIPQYLWGIARDITERKKNEETFQLVINNIPALVSYVDSDERYLFVNRSYEKAFGKSKNEIIGQHIKDILGEDGYKAVEQNLRRVLSGEPVNFEEQFRWSDNVLHNLDVNYVPHTNQDGKTIGFFALVLDITDRKKAEKAFRESEKQYRQLVESLQEGIWVIDKNAKTTFVNSPMAAMLGYRDDEMLGMNLFEFMSEESIKFAKENLARRKAGVSEQHDFEFLGKDGSSVYAILEAKPITDEMGNYNGAIAGVINITERKLLEDELREKELLLESVGRMAKVGGWEFDVRTSEVRWTEETHRIHDVTLDYRPSLQEAIDFFHPEDRERLAQAIQKALNDGKPYDMEIRFITAKGHHLWTHTICRPEVVNGKTVKLRGTFQDITGRKKLELELKKAYDKLQDRNLQLEEARERLEKLNTGLQVVVEHRTEEIRQLEKNLIENANKLITPYIEKMDKKRMGSQNRAYLEVITSNLEQLVSPFARNLSSKMASLTPGQIQIADLIRKGKTSKEIASALNISMNSVSAQRFKIRKRLNLLNKKVNLSSYLQSLSQ